LELGELTDKIRCVLLGAQSSVVSFLLDELLEIKQTVVTRRNQLLMNLEGRFPYTDMLVKSDSGWRIAYGEPILGKR
jgi:hypothetical protein